MIDRKLTPQLGDAIAHSSAVALLGPRQVGKSTLALEIGQRHNSLYLDLETEQDQAKLAQPELYLLTIRTGWSSLMRFTVLQVFTLFCVVSSTVDEGLGDDPGNICC